MESIKEHPVNSSPYRNKDGDIIIGEKNWNDIIETFPPLYPEYNQQLCQKIYTIRWSINESEHINIDFYYTRTHLHQKFLKISIELKYYNPLNTNDENTNIELNELYKICNYFIKIGIEEITYINNPEIKFLTKSKEFPIIHKLVVQLPEHNTKYYFNYYYPINRDKGDNVTKNCIIDLCNKIFHMIS